MFPIGKQNLSLLEIADYWSREIRPPASRKELLRLLESAWWLGEIHGDSILIRLELLKRMFQSMGDRTDLGIVFITGEGQEQSTIERLRDGSVVVDVRPQIPLPSTDIGSWDEGNCESAFLALAQTASVESYPEITPALAFIELSFSEFTSWLAKRDFDKPKFWKPQSKTRLTRSKRGHPPEYNWDGVKRKLEDYVAREGPVERWDELMQKCADFAHELHPTGRTPSDKTIRDAIKKYQFDVVMGIGRGK